MKHDDERGSVAPGKLADLVLIDGDPVARISDIRKPVLVVRGGVVFDPKEINAALGVQ